MRIQELERKTGLERPSIRFYEKEGLLNPKRFENGYREYTEEDVELLKKIKLLRRLGMSVEKIRVLQQGSEDLSSAIAHLTVYHSSQIDDHKRCRAVCEAIHNDGTDFATLDAEHYLGLMREIRINDQALGRTDFRESIPKEIHPWRRYIASPWSMNGIG